MGERLSGEGVPGRQHVQSGGVLSGRTGVRDTDALESVLAAAIRAADLAPGAEQQAVAAFRAAHAAGAHPARTRRRDDWRPAAQRRAGRPLKLTCGVAFACLALGGGAVAAIGSAGSSTDGGPVTTHPSAVAPDRPGGAGSSPSAGSARSADGPDPAQDTEAHCRAYEQVQGHGKALDATAWQQLVAAAGSEDKVDAYCSEQLAASTATPSRSTAGKSSKAAADSDGTSGNGTFGNGQANAGQDNGKGR
ncbi:hypothetical protein [Streptomyces sp. TLI_185]|uniref:hypothetical protein n=1 Tax=Streptomyces sp. TLI_185 TaxID=2485151 RepID=UPI000F505495|nr:hypothetical protein [Streptomyces sp. TLI_185]RPF37412.1 hypothetical protein EDD92_7490 [Streptomyces sp. TLI_185]